LDPATIIIILAEHGIQSVAISEVDKAFTSLKSLGVRFAGWERPDIPVGECALLEEEVGRIEQALPGLLPPLDPVYLRGSCPPVFGLYKATRLLHWLDIALARLRTARERRTTDPLGILPRESTPAFDFVASPDLQAILRRDFNEIERALAARCWKAVIILCGGILEGLLIDAISRTAAGRTDEQSDSLEATTRMSLNRLINRALELKLLGSGVVRLPHTLREYRNLVHVGAELRGELRISEPEADLSFAITRMVERDLSELQH